MTQRDGNLLRIVKDLRGGAGQPITAGSRGERAPVAIDQLDPHDVFELLDGVGHGRLRHPEALGSERHIAQLANRCKHLQCPQIKPETGPHVAIPKWRSLSRASLQSFKNASYYKDYL